MLPYPLLARARVALARGDLAAARAGVDEAVALGDAMGMPVVRRAAARVESELESRPGR